MIGEQLRWRFSTAPPLAKAASRIQTPRILNRTFARTDIAWHIWVVMLFFLFYFFKSRFRCQQPLKNIITWIAVKLLYSWIYSYHSPVFPTDTLFMQIQYLPAGGAVEVVEIEVSPVTLYTKQSSAHKHCFIRHYMQDKIKMTSKIFWWQSVSFRNTVI